MESRREHKANNVALIRLEQLYPFPESVLDEVIAPYQNLKEVVWCQEEPLNQGAWYSSQHHMRRVILRHDDSLYMAYAGREALAAPASGHIRVHSEKQRRLVEDALFG